MQTRDFNLTINHFTDQIGEKNLISHHKKPNRIESYKPMIISPNDQISEQTLCLIKHSVLIYQSLRPPWHLCRFISSFFIINLASPTLPRCLLFIKTGYTAAHSQFVFYMNKHIKIEKNWPCLSSNPFIYPSIHHYTSEYTDRSKGMLFFFLPVQSRGI